MPTAYLPMMRLRIDLALEEAWQAPPFMGSLLRGLFGHSLKALACTTHLPTCNDCPFQRNCSYTTLFEPPPQVVGFATPQAPPVPFVLRIFPPAERHFRTGDPLVFEQILFGHAIEQLPLIQRAWKQAIQQGLGPQRTSIRLVRMLTEEVAMPALAELPVKRLTLKLHTPTRLRVNKCYLGANELTARDFLMALARRIGLLEQTHLADPPRRDYRELVAVAERISLAPRLEWVDWQRWSNRQKRHMQLGGLMGDIELVGPLDDFMPLLVIGEWLHVGKNATFGLGRYSLVS